KDCRIELDQPGAAAAPGLLPEGIAELLRRVWVAQGDGEPGLDRLVADGAAGRLESLPDERREGLRSDHAELHVPRAPPERLVRVHEETLHDAALAAQIHMGHFRLRLDGG